MVEAEAGINNNKTNATYEITDAPTNDKSNRGIALERSVQKKKTYWGGWHKKSVLLRGWRGGEGSLNQFTRAKLTLYSDSAPNYKPMFSLPRDPLPHL